MSKPPISATPCREIARLADVEDEWLYFHRWHIMAVLKNHLSITS